MKFVFSLSAVMASLACLVSPVIAGVPKSESILEGKWQRINDSWAIDTEDVDIKRDKIRFWTKRNSPPILEWKNKSKMRRLSFEG